MPPCPFSTRGGEYGFSVAFADGSVMTEKDGTWDDVPQDRPIVSAALSHLGTLVDFVRLKGFTSFFFSNEAYATRDGQKNTHTAKILGGVNSDGSVVEARLDFAAGNPTPLKSQRSYSRAECTFGENAFRSGELAK